MCSVRCDKYPTEKSRSTTLNTICSHTGHVDAAMSPAGRHDSARIAATDASNQFERNDNPVNARLADRLPRHAFAALNNGTIVSNNVPAAMIVRIMVTFVRNSRVVIVILQTIAIVEAR